MPSKAFDPSFIWGTATSSYQIEGALDFGGRGPSIWDTFATLEGKVKDGLDGTHACDHWNRFEEDVALMKALGAKAYRFSIAWPRVFPTGTETQPLTAGLDWYERLVDHLLANGIDPWVTLYHWDMPQALEEAGGWPNRDVVDHFVRYAEVVARRLGDRVGNWITHNEPWCVAHLGYGNGVHAPGRENIADSLAAAHHVLLSHGRAMPVLREILPDSANVGITLNFVPAYPASDSPEDAAATERFDGFFNRWYLHPLIGKGYPEDMLEHYLEEGHLDALQPSWLQPTDLEEMSAPIDFLGINYYSRGIIRDEKAEDNAPRTIPEPPDEVKTDIGWEVFPDGLHRLLMRLHRDTDGLPLVITENGAAYSVGPGDDGSVDDEAREAYFNGHLNACHDAIADGANLIGYFAWSLLDNFEWQEGYTQRFGLIYVDYETQIRTPKRSFKWLSGVMKSGELPG